MEKLDLLEPALLYERELKDKHHELVCKTFDDLVKKSKVDVEANKATCAELYKKQKELNKAKDKASSLRGLNALFILMIVFGSIALAVGVIMIVMSNLIGIAVAAGGVALLVGGILLVVKVYKPRIKNVEKLCNELEKKIEELFNEANNQMAPLNALFEESISARLFSKTCPLIEMDRIFDMTKYQMLRDKYGMWDNGDEDVSVLALQSGSILGNPFVFFKDLNKDMVQETYKGSLTISWTESDGKNTYHRTQTLTATYTAPKPVYSEETYLVYANEGAQKLSFSRKPSNINSMTEDQIKKYVRKHECDLDKLAEKETKKGGTYTPIGNPEFELFFGGLDRDDEVEFRLLFTALGQKSMMQLLKSTAGFGDDFSFRKVKGLNLIQSSHSQGSALFNSADAFKGYDINTVKDYFIIYNDAYFKAVFFDLAPLLAIPLYQQYKTHEYIYKGKYESNITPFEHEVVSNRFSRDTFAHPKTKTETILKTKILNKKDGSDVVAVTAHSFDAIPRIEYIPVRGGDGYYHDVPVHWTEYVPLSKVSSIEIADIGVDEESKFNSLGNNDIIYAKGLLSNQGNLNVDIKQIKKLLMKE